MMKNNGNDGLEMKQIKVLDRFFRETRLNRKKIAMAWVGIGASILLLILLMVLPQKNWKEGIVPWMSTLFFAVCASLTYVSVYFSHYLGYEDRYSMVHYKLRYLPVSIELIRKYRFNKLWKFQVVLYLSLQAIHLMFCVLLHHEVGLGNIGYVFLTVLLAPLLIGAGFLRISV